MKEMEYFGTDLSQAGHYFYKITEQGLHGTMGCYTDKVKEIGFCPESMPKTGINGRHEYYQTKGYSIIAICGSCTDHRGGSKSVFFVKDKLAEEEMIKEIKSYPIAMKILNKMPFEVQILKEE